MDFHSILRGGHCQIGSCLSLYFSNPQPADGFLTRLVHTLGTVQHRTKSSTRSPSELLLLALASLGPERSREAFGSINPCPLPDVPVRDEPGPGERPEPVRDKARAADPPRAAESHLGRFFLALSNETRRNILRLLEAREYCATEIVSHFELSQPTISSHLSVLKKANLVTNRRVGQRVFYRLSGETLARAAVAFFCDFRILKGRERSPHLAHSTRFA